MIRVRWIFIFFIIIALPGYLFPLNADEEEPERNIYEIVRYGTIDDLKALKKKYQEKIKDHK